MNTITNLTDALTPNLPFGDVWIDRDEHNTTSTEFGYVRADHDGSCWWNTWWPKHESFRTPELVVEFNALYNAFKVAFPDLPSMMNWCYKSAKRVANDEFNAYYVGEYGCYWLRMITRRRDYNLYLHCFSKAAMQERGIQV